MTAQPPTTDQFDTTYWRHRALKAKEIHDESKPYHQWYEEDEELLQRTEQPVEAMLRACDEIDALRARAAAADNLANLNAMLVTLVRIGFLVSFDGERATLGTIADPAMSELLYAILHAEDSAAAVDAVAAYAAATTQTKDGT